MSNTLSYPEKPAILFQRVGILFAGGPAPAANAVISAAATSFLRAGVQVIGIKHGYSSLVEFGPDRPLIEGRDYLHLTHKLLARTRNSQGILIGTSRTNPGKFVTSPNCLRDPERSAPFRRVYDALRSINVDALISIGGDDTLKSANKFKVYQDLNLMADKVIPIVHLPKTIDNDYHGIDFTFGFFTAVDFLAAELRNLIYDAEVTRSYFVAETMGRSAGWLAYGAAIAGEASFVISVEDIIGEFRSEETITTAEGETLTRPIMDMDRVVQRIVKTMLAREREGKEYGVVVLAEGLAEFLPYHFVEGVRRDDHGHISISEIDLCDIFSDLVSAAYTKHTGRRRRIKGLQLGYESRCAKPHAFDVMLGSQLGVGAYRALAEKQLNGVMVSVTGQLDLHYEPFESLVDPKTMVTVVRYIRPGSDFHRLARFLETQVAED
ncbi:MAG TPA: 6-phosphofructokinase [Pirellulaceae bacterium]|nr:6-phosphofructokinase [Pirellulaceae bacterium]